MLVMLRSIVRSLAAALKCNLSVLLLLFLSANSLNFDYNVRASCDGRAQVSELCMDYFLRLKLQECLWGLIEFWVDEAKHRLIGAEG